MTAAWRDEEFADLSADMWEPLEQCVRDFEAALASQSQPDLTDFLPDSDPSNGQLLVELVHSELEFRIAAGENARVEDYLERFPQLATRSISLLGLIKAEFQHRSVKEPQLRLADYSERFPQLAAFLAASRHDFVLGPKDTLGDIEATRPRTSDTSVESSPELPTVPGYALIEEIGRGGMGLVYKAIETRLGRLVALKTVLPGAKTVERARLRREAEAAASLQNPNVVQVYHVFEDAGRLYVASEFLPGGTLAKRVARRPLLPSEVAVLVEPIARAVADAHGCGIIHRDLKPSNILIAADGTPKIADFGLSKWIDEDSELTKTGVVAGSPSYMAPEQADAQIELSPAVDIWAIGAILYELLTGRPPFQAATVLDTLEQVRHSEPIPPRKLVPRVPRDLETICLKCLEKNPLHRYPSAIALADDLARFRRGEIVQARPVGSIGRIIRWSRHRPAFAALLCVLMLSSAFGTAGLLYHLGELRQLNRTLGETAARAENSQKRAEASERSTQRLLFASDMGQVAQAVRDGDLLRAGKLLKTHRAHTASEFAFISGYLDRLVHSPGKVIDNLGGAAYFVAFSPDGKTLAACGESGEVSLYEVGTWKRKDRFATGQVEVNGLAFDREGRRMLTVGDDGTVALWDLAQHREIRRRKVFEFQAYQVAFGSNDTLLAVCGRDPDIVILDVATFGEVARLPADKEYVDGIAATPDGRTLVAAGRNGALAIDFQSQLIRWRHKADEDSPALVSVAVSSDGQLAAFGTRDSTITLVGIDDGFIQRETLAGSPLGHDATWYRAACFLPASDKLAVASDAGVVHLVGVGDAGLVSSDDLPRKAWTAHGDRIGCVTASGEFVVTASRDGTVAVWQPHAEPAWRKISLPAHSDIISTFHPGNGYQNSLRFATIPTSANEPAPIHLTDLASLDSNIAFAGGTHWRDLASSSDGSQLFASSENSKIAGWDMTGTAPAPLFEKVSPELTTPELGGVTRDGKRFVVHYWWPNPNGERESELHIVDGENGTTLASRRLWYGMPPADIAEDGSLVVAVQEKEVLLLEPRNLKTRQTLLQHKEKIVALRLSKDAQRLATVGDDREVIIWDIRTGEHIGRWQADTSEIKSVSFSPDGRLLLTATKSRPPRLWDIESRRLVLELSVTPNSEFLDQWSPAEFTVDGQCIIAGSGRSFLVLDGRPLTASD